MPSDSVPPSEDCQGINQTSSKILTRKAGGDKDSREPAEPADERRAVDSPIAQADKCVISIDADVDGRADYNE